MYQVVRNNRPILKGQTFDNYEKARQALRKYIRQLVNKGKAERWNFGGPLANWDSISRNPVNFTYAGFNIRKVS